MATNRWLSLLAFVLVASGCVAPLTTESRGPSASASEGTPSTSAAPTASAPAPSATTMPTPAAWQSGGFVPPDGILPPNSIVEVIVDALQLRSEPGLGADVTGLATTGDRFTVTGWFGPVARDGIDWYRLGPATVGDIDVWAAAGSGADRYLEIVATDCPPGDPDLAAVVSMSSDWDRLTCFGDRPLTFEGTFGCGPCDGTTAGDFQPFWLAWPLGGSYLWADFQAGIGPLLIRAPDDGRVDLPEVGSIVRLAGHFSDPASTTCTLVTFVGEQATPVDPRTAEMYCREQFVIETIDVIGTDPTYTDPYHP